MKKFWEYLLLNVSMLLILIGVLDLGASIFEYPVCYGKDMLQVLMSLKMIITGDFPFYSYATSQYIGSPFGFNGGDFPMPMASNILFVKFLSLFTANIFALMNLYIVSSYFMIVNAMFFVLKKLRVDCYLAIVVALLYSLVPFHFSRIGHFWYVNYFLLPITVYYLLLLWNSKPLFFRKIKGKNEWTLDFSTNNISILLILALFSVWNYYYSFFFVFFTFVATISAFSYRRTKYHLFSGLLMMFVVIAPFVVNFAPYKIYQYKNGKNSLVANRAVSDAEVYGLKIVQMLLPVKGHNSGTLATIKSRYKNMPLVNENSTSTLGLMGAIGFFIMTFYMLFNERVFSTIKKLSIITYAAVFFATIGGYSSLFSVLITPQIRGYNRISIYISTIALIVFSIVVNRLLNKYRVRKIGRLVVVISILALGIYDQVPVRMSFEQKIKGIINEFKSDQHFIRKIEEKLALTESKSILQLPHMSYPEHPPINKMTDYAQIVGFLHSDSLKWSYGAVRGRESDGWLNALLSRSLEEQLEQLSSSGFSGIYIDRRGYADNGRLLEESIGNLLNSSPTVSEDRQKSFFSVQSTGNFPDRFNYFAKGFYGWEGEAFSFGWTNGNTIMYLSNNQNGIRQYDLSFVVGTLRKRNVAITFNGKEMTSFHLSSGGSRSVNLLVDLVEGRNKLELTTDSAAHLPGNGDPRMLAFSLSKMVVSQRQE